MNAASYAFAMLFYLAALILAGGLATRILTYWLTPAPLKIPTTPAPVTSTGVGFRMAREILLFESLFKSNLWIWGLGWAFHVGLALVLIRHLRYFTEPVWIWVTLMQPFGVYAGFAMVAGILGLWARRIFVERIRYISTISDHLILALLAGIALSGVGMRFVTHTDVIGVKMFFLGLMRADLHPVPSDGLLYTHLALVAGLMIVFPFSKLLHAPGIFFSPTRNQADDPRERRHLAPWAEQLEMRR